jgi:undecaprenyl-diphosphatase
MNIFDKAIIEFVNQYSQLNPLVDKTIYTIAQNHSLKGGVIVTLLWWAWLRRSGQLIDRSFAAIYTMVGALIALFVARVMQNTLPYRPRPVFAPELNFVVPESFDPTGIDRLSSFPSDHAVLFFSLATALWLADRRVGLFAYIWTTVVICFPRIFLGYHHPTDIIAGAVIGIAIMLGGRSLPVPSWACARAADFQARHAGILYAGAFLLTFQMATLFEGMRRLGSAAGKVVALVL